MTLDITEVASQIANMVVKIKSSDLERREHLACALDKLCNGDIDLSKLREKIKISHTQNWSPAGLFEGLNLRFPAPPRPQEYTAIATDGSHIDVDRHRAAHCYLINIGAIKLDYGENPSAELESEPHLYSQEEELVIKNLHNTQQKEQVRGNLLDIKRSVEECRKLAEMAARLPGDRSTLALMDGSLVLFGIQNYPDFVVEELLDKGLIKALDGLKNTNRVGRLALASYISLPQSDEVVNIIRIAICPHEMVDCDRNCSEIEPACNAVSLINDRMLFGNFLQPGERSAAFVNPSFILKRYGAHQVYFFYLRVDDEIARVEVPKWVADDKQLLDLAHSLVLDQCRRGHGYPVALSEAHEKAVVTGADREEFWSLVEESLEEEDIRPYTSTKNRSKRTRWI
jgi:hypothetical protein